MNPDESLARRRFAIITLMRALGAALVVIGVLVLAGKLALPRPVGTALIVLGAVDFLVVPLVLARSWRTPR